MECNDILWLCGLACLLSALCWLGVLLWWLALLLLKPELRSLRRNFHLLISLWLSLRPVDYSLAGVALMGGPSASYIQSAVHAVDTAAMYAFLQPVSQGLKLLFSVPEARQWREAGVVFCALVPLFMLTGCFASSVPIGLAANLGELFVCTLQMHQIARVIKLIQSALKDCLNISDRIDYKALLKRMRTGIWIGICLFAVFLKLVYTMLASIDAGSRLRHCKDIQDFMVNMALNTVIIAFLMEVLRPKQSDRDVDDVVDPTKPTELKSERFSSAALSNDWRQSPVPDFI